MRINIYSFIRYTLPSLIFLLCLSGTQASGQSLYDKFLQQLNKAQTYADSVDIYLQLEKLAAYRQTGTIAESQRSRYDELARKVAIAHHDDRLLLRVNITKSNLYGYDDQKIRDNIIADSGYIAQALALKDTVSLALATFRQVKLYTTIDSPIAQVKLNEAVDLYEQLNDKIGLGECYVGLSDFFYRCGDEISSTHFAVLALNDLPDNAMQVGGYINRGYALMTLAINMQNKRQYSAAVGYYMAALKIFDVCDASAYQFSILENIGWMHFMSKRYDSAISYFNKAAVYARFNTNKYYNAHLCLDLSKTYFARNDLSQATSYLDSSIKYTNEIKDDRLRNSMRFYLAALKGERGDVKTAIILLERLLANCSKNQFERLSTDICSLLSNLYEQQGQSSKALLFSKMFIERGESVAKHEKLINAQVLQSEYEKEKSAKKLLEHTTADKLGAEKALRKSQFLFFALAISLLLLSIALSAKLIIDHFRKQMVMEKENLVKMQQNALMVIEAQEAERQKIARELHDGLGTYLYTALIGLETIKEYSPEIVAPIITNTRSAIDLANVEIRNILNGLTTETLTQFGLSVALEAIVELINKLGRIRIKFQCEEHHEILSASLATAIYRIVQELFSNTLKHSLADQAQLMIRINKSVVSIDYSDNGIGYSTTATHTGNGLKNIAMKVNIYNGTCKMSSHDGSGFYISLSFPNYRRKE